MAAIAQGVDYAFSHPTDDELVAAGKAFVVRYVYPFSQKAGTKNLTLTEANGHKAHGRKIVSNYESWSGRADEGYAAGQADARAADAQHRACGGPSNRPIFFSVDFDTVPGDYPKIDAYFRGVASVIGLARTGAYGEYDLVKHLMDNNLVGKAYVPAGTAPKFYCWQCYAWSGGKYDERCVLAQDKNNVNLGSGNVDLDSAHNADYGQWDFVPPIKPVPPTLANVSAQAVLRPGQTVDAWAREQKVPYGSVFTGPGGHVWTYALHTGYAPKGSPNGITAQSRLLPGQTTRNWAAHAGVRPEAVQSSNGYAWTYSPRGNPW